MLEKYEWISNERQFFGQPNTAYDFAANDMKEVSRRLSKLQETKEKLRLRRSSPQTKFNAILVSLRDLQARRGGRDVRRLQGK